MHFERAIVAHLTFILLGFGTTTASNIKRQPSVIVPVNKDVNSVTLRYTNELLQRQRALGANFRAEFMEILRGANETLMALRRGAEDIRKGQLNEATPQEADEVMPLRKNYSQMIQQTANLWMVDDKMIAATSMGSSLRAVIENLKGQKTASEAFGRVVVSKMPSSLHGRLSGLDNAAHFALQNAIGLWKSRDDLCESGGSINSPWCPL
jgi:hypothetical protein